MPAAGGTGPVSSAGAGGRGASVAARSRCASATRSATRSCGRRAGATGAFRSAFRQRPVNHEPVPPLGSGATVVSSDSTYGPPFGPYAAAGASTWPLWRVGEPL